MDILNSNMSAEEAEKRFMDSLTPEQLAFMKGQITDAYDVMVPDYDAQGRGYDLRSYAFRNRVVYLHGPVTEASMNLLCMQMQYLCVPASLKKEQRERRILVYVNSPGGAVWEGLLLMEYIRQVREVTNEPVYVINQARAASMGSAITQAASPGCRMGFISSVHMIHESAYGNQGKTSGHAAQLGLTAKAEVQLWREYERAIVDSLVIFKGVDPNDPKLRAQVRYFIMSQTKNRDSFLMASQAQQYSLLDFVIPSNTLQVQYYNAMEIYLGLRKYNPVNPNERSIRCDLWEGQSQPFVFDKQKLTDDEIAVQKAEGQRQLRELRQASLDFCAKRQTELDPWVELLDKLDHSSYRSGTGVNAGIGKRIEGLFTEQGFTPDDLSGPDSPFYVPVCDDNA